MPFLRVSDRKMGWASAKKRTTWRLAGCEALLIIGDKEDHKERETSIELDRQLLATIPCKER